MKTIITIILVSLSFISSYGQDLKLSIIKNSDEPNTSTEHYYLIGITNTSKKATSFSISTANINCADKKMERTDFSHQILNKQKSRQAEQLKIQAGESIEMFIKLNRSQNAKLNSWNCTEIKAITNSDLPISNAIVIESFIPDPKDFN